ncbi:MAG: alpha,alpha-trehalase TreF [Allomuricauda sp.]|nr:MAG: alpha,alpha-trehalase TreF [Allomuricauda sp.]
MIIVLYLAPKPRIVKQRIIFSLVVLLAIASCKQETTTEVVDPYETQLFKDVQLAAIYKDSKTFVDLVPKAPYAELEAKYIAEKEMPNFDLQEFVDQNFEDRSMKSLEITTDTTKTMYEHIEGMWDKLTRGPDSTIPNSSRIALPNKYVVPGGRFQEIYYWDSYFTIEGLLAAGRRDLAKSMIDNFAHLLNTQGFIPNGTRDYFMTRSQPPFFSMMVGALARKDRNMLLYYLPELEKEYQFFMKHDSISRPYDADRHVVKLIGDGVLNRYWDEGNTPRPEAYKEDVHLASSFTNDADKERLYKDLRSGAESGWDFSSRWFLQPGEFSSTGTTSIIPVDLNCLLFGLESLLSRAYLLKGDRDTSTRYRALANDRRALINDYLWSEEKGYYMDFDFKRAEHTPHMTLAGAYPLFFAVAPRDRAEKVKDALMETFLKDGGLVTTLEHSGQQWDAPNGWAPLQWIAVNGLLSYQHNDEAREIMNRWLALNERVYKNTGKMMEKYNVEDLTLLSGGGEYETQDGFGWTNGVALGFHEALRKMDSVDRVRK